MPGVLAVQNKLYNSQTSISSKYLCPNTNCLSAPSTSFSFSLTQNACFSTGNSYYTTPNLIVDDSVIGTSSDSGAVCTNFQTQQTQNTITFQIIMAGGAVQARTFMSVFTKNSVNDPKFQATTNIIYLTLGSNLIYTSSAVVGKNGIWTTGSQRITFDYLQTETQYNSVAVGDQLSVCLDNFYALDQYYLNPYIYYYHLYQQQLDNTWLTGTITPSPTSSTFSQGSNCFLYTNPFNPPKPTRFYIRFNSQSTPVGSVILTNIFTQLGSGHLGNTYIALTYWKFNSTNQWQLSNSTLLVNSTGQATITTNQYLPLPTAYIVSTNFISQSAASQFSLCSFQNFGWPFCEVSAVSFTGQSAIIVNSGDSIAFDSQVVAYYDPINLLMNNPFCSLTLNATLLIDGSFKVFNFTINTTTMRVNNQVFTLALNGVAQTFTASLDPNQLKLNFLYTGSILSTKSGNHTFQLQAIDSRDTSATAVKSTNSFTVNFACDSIGLSTASSQFVFQNSSITNNQTFTYLVGQGEIGQINFTSSAICTGFLGTLSTAYYIQNSIQINTTMGTNASEFEVCKNSTSQDICFFLDQNNQWLQYFSNYGSNYTFYIQVFAKFVGKDKSGIKQLSTTVKTLDLVVQTQNFVCRNTTFNFKLVQNQNLLSQQNLDFLIDVNSQTGTQYQIQFVNSCSSSNLKCDGTNDCGPFHFDLSADPLDVKFKLAQSFVNSANMIIYNDPFLHTFDMIIIPNGSFISELPLVYNLVVGLQTLQQLYPSLDPVQSFKVSLNFVAIKPKNNQINYNYTIGLPNAAFPLPQYVIQPSKYIISSITVQQISGKTIPLTDIEVNVKSLTLSLKTKDITLSNTTVIFILTAILNNPQNTNNSDLTINVNFIGFPDTESKASASAQQKSFTTSQKQAESLYEGWVRPQRNQSLSIPIHNKPAWVQEISQTGQVKIRFGKPLYLPFTLNRILSQEFLPQNFINKNNTLIQLQTKTGMQQLNWIVTNITTTNLDIQLLFNNTYSVSADSKDYLFVNFKDVDQFVLSNKQDYLFQNQSQANLFAIVPPQYPSTKIQEILISVGTVAKQSAVTVLTLSLIVQIIAKKVIQTIWAYYSALQLVLLICQESNIQNSASVITLTNTIDDIISLQALDKQQIINGIKLPQSISAGLQSYKTIALISIPLAFILLIVIVASKFFKKESVQNILKKIKLMLFWNFLIRYFQASYINFQFSSMTQIMNGSAFNISSSSLIIVAQIAVVLIMFIYLYRVDLQILDKQDQKKKIGNMYLGLNTKKRQNIMYSLCFYMQRTLIIVILATDANFGVQTVLIQTILLINASILYTIKPYLHQYDSMPEDLNTFALLVLQEFQLLLSTWVDDPTLRFKYGIVYDSLIVLLFLLNVLLVLRVVQRDGTIKLKRAYLLLKRRYDQILFQRWYQKDCEREKRVVQELEQAQEIWKIRYRFSKEQNKLHSQIQLELEELSHQEINSQSHKTDDSLSSVKSFERYACRMMEQEGQFQFNLPVNQDIEPQIIVQSFMKDQKISQNFQNANYEQPQQMVGGDANKIKEKMSQEGMIAAKTKPQNLHQLDLSQLNQNRDSVSYNQKNKPEKSKLTWQLSESNQSSFSKSSDSEDFIYEQRELQSNIKHEIGQNQHEYETQQPKHVPLLYQLYPHLKDRFAQNQNQQVIQESHSTLQIEQAVIKNDSNVLNQNSIQQPQNIPLLYQLQPHLRAMLSDYQNQQSSQVSYQQNQNQYFTSNNSRSREINQKISDIYISSESEAEVQINQINELIVTQKEIHHDDQQNLDRTGQNSIYKTRVDSRPRISEILQKEEEKSEAWLDQYFLEQKERKVRNKKQYTELKLKILRELDQQ